MSTAGGLGLLANQSKNLWDRVSPALFHSQNPKRKHKDVSDQVKAQLNSKSQQSKGEQQKPDKWIEDQCSNGDRPAKDKEDAPKEESQHGFVVL